MYFFTVNLADPRSTLPVDAISQLRDAVRYEQARHCFEIRAWVVLPDHIHAIWRLAPGDSAYSLRWRLIKSCFSRKLPGLEVGSRSRRRKGEWSIWQRRFWEHLLRDQRDYRMHMDYVHFNPVKHGYVSRAAEWPYSTLNRYVASGVYLADWGVSANGFQGHFGEAGEGWRSGRFGKVD